MKRHLPTLPSFQRGQSLVEYTLIVFLVIFALAAAVAATGPAIGNVFSNTVYNLLGANPDEISDLPDDDDFWLTVTWVATQTPAEVPLPTRTPAPPTKTPTAGPSPTNTPVTPTKTPTPTQTPSPSPTPRDIHHIAPWHDTADNEVHWRLDTSIFLGTDPGWYGLYYPNRAITGAPSAEGYLSDIDESLKYNLTFDWGNDAPVSGTWPAGNDGDDWSAVFRREIFIEAPTTLMFDVPITNNGIRVWILGGAFGGNPSVQNGGPGNCSGQGVTSGGNGGNSGNWNVYDDAFFGYNHGVDPIANIPTECLLLDRWRHGDTSSINGVQRTLDAGIYTIQVDFYEECCTAQLSFQIGSASLKANPDDTRVDGSGSPVAGVPNCVWGANDSNNANSLENMFDSYNSGGEFASGNECYLELRGSVEIPGSITDPVLTFWDAWDFDQSTVTAWVDIAEYVEDAGGGLDRAALSWNTFIVHQGDGVNYNWTRQKIDLNTVFGVASGGLTGRRITLRFGMRNNNSTQTRFWYIDSINIDQEDVKSFYPAQTWNLDDVVQAADFITSGRWELSSEKARGGAGLAWDDSVDENYDALSGRRDNSYADYNLRMHTLEFNGFIDVDDPLGLTDDEGDSGNPMLTFWHSYRIGRRTGLEIQYTTAPYGTSTAADGTNTIWNTIPNHVIVDRDHGTSDLRLDSMSFVEIDLQEIVDVIGPGTPFRLRFAMTVRDDAYRRDGWWIDDIRLERQGRNKFTDFPFHDPAEDPTDPDNWLMGGSWAREPGGYNPPAGQTGFSYTDSPAGNYSPNVNASMELKWPVDFNLDSETNPASPACTLVPSQLCTDVADGQVPVNPRLTFYHIRKLASGENFYIEWKRADQDDTEWKELWVYYDRNTRDNGLNDDTRYSTQWEFVEVSLEPVFNHPDYDNNVPSAWEDDDVVFRFRFDTSGSSQQDGIYIDDIRIQDYTERTHILWPLGVNRQVDSGGTMETGDGEVYQDNLDNDVANLFDKWIFSGTWQVVDWDQYDGVLSFHDSTAIPYPSSGGTEFAPPDSPNFTKLTDNSYMVLEMDTIIDLRAVDASERPILSFWTKYDIGNRTRISVEIQYEDPSVINSGLFCRSSSRDQCYDHRYGWSEWDRLTPTTYSWDRYNRRNYAWNRELIDLSPYTQQGANYGKRIRIRFVVNTYDVSGPTSSDLRDGWWLDNILIEHYNPNVEVIDRGAGQSFFDGARNTKNWIFEGSWGLSPEFFRGSGGGPASLGNTFWNYDIWDLRYCSWGSFKTCADAFLDGTSGTNYTNTAPVRSGANLDINFDWGNGGPVPGVTQEFAGRWTLVTAPVEGVAAGTIPAGDYTFIATSDDGVRLKYDTHPTPGGLVPNPQLPDPYNPEWNIINNWNHQSRTISMGTALLAGPTGGNPPPQYQLTLEFFERGGNAAIILTIGTNSFSFTDSPKQGTGAGFPDVPAIPRASSSMIFDGVFDLTNATNPIVQYYTLYELGGRARVEVSIDGGFTWTSANLQGVPPSGFFTSNWIGDYFDDRGRSGNRLDYNAATNRSDPTAFPPVISGQDDGTDIDFNWGGGRPAGMPSNNDYSIRWTRNISLATATTVTFSISSDDGHRLWLNYFDQCDFYNGSNPMVNGRPKFNAFDDRENDDPSTSCLLIDDWENSGNNVSAVTRTIPAGNHTLQLDFYEASGGARIELDILAGAFDTPVYNGVELDTWELRQHDLTAYAGAGQPFVALRFRLDRLGNSTAGEGNDYQVTNQSPVNWFESVWITDISVIDP